MIQYLTRRTKAKWAFALTKKIHWFSYWISWSWVTDEQILTKWFTDSDLLTCWTRGEQILVVVRKIQRATWQIRKAQISAMTTRFTDSVTDSFSNKWMNLRLDQKKKTVHWFNHRLAEWKKSESRSWLTDSYIFWIHWFIHWLVEWKEWISGISGRQTYNINLF